VLLHRPDAFGRDHPQAGEAEIIIGKRRAGQTETIGVVSQLHLSRFGNMANDWLPMWFLKFNVHFSSQMSTRCPIGHQSENSAVPRSAGICNRLTTVPADVPCGGERRAPIK
jgi:hypothetical protein